jgi:hypothetical protein
MPMVSQQPRRRYWPCRLMILFMCGRIVSQPNLGDYYCVLKRLQKCEGIDVPRQAGVHLLRSSIPPAEGGVLVLRNTCVPRQLQCSSTTIRRECTEICIRKSILLGPRVRHLTGGDSLTKGARTSTVILSGRRGSAGCDDLVQLTATPFQLDRLPLPSPRETNGLYGDQEPDASPASVGRPLDTVFYT